MYTLYTTDEQKKREHETLKYVTHIYTIILY